MDERIIRTKLEQIRQRTVRDRWPISRWQARLAQHLAPGEYRYLSEWTPLPPGETLWPAGQTLFLQAQAQPPVSAARDDLYLEFDAQGLEGLLSVNGRPYAGVDANHPRVVLPAAEAFDLSAEFICQPASLSRPELRRERARLRAVSFVQVDRSTEAAYYDLRFAWEAGLQASDDRRRELLRAALEEALLIVDLTAPQDLFLEQVARAR